MRTYGCPLWFPSDLKSIPNPVPNMQAAVLKRRTAQLHLRASLIVLMPRVTILRQGLSSRIQVVGFIVEAIQLEHDNPRSRKIK